MKTISRSLLDPVRRASRGFPAVVLTGPRRAGKTTLLRTLLPSAQYVLLEDPDVVSRVRADPRMFVEELRPPAILDEIQNAPELFAYLRTRIDAAPRRVGQWYLTGSQEAPLMRGVTESMAGRAAVFRQFAVDAQHEVDGAGPVAVDDEALLDLVRSQLVAFGDRAVRDLHLVAAALHAARAEWQRFATDLHGL